MFSGFPFDYTSFDGGAPPISGGGGVVAPDACTIGTATLGDGQASVTFTANGTGGSAIIDYLLTSTVGGYTKIGTSSPIVIGVPNGVASAFYVQARNIAGYSTPSSNSNTVTPAVNLAGRSYLSATLNNNYPLAPALSNSQVKLTLTSTHAALFLGARSDGADVLVVDSDFTTVMTFWLQAYDAVAQTATIWLKVPSLAQGSTKAIRLYWGAPNQPVSVGSFSNTMQKTAVDAGTIAVFHLDEGSGTTAADAVGTYTGTLLNAPSWGAGDGGNYMNASPRQVFASGSHPILNGSNQALTIPGLLDTPPDSGGILMWFRPDTSNPGAGYQALFSKINDGAGQIGYTGNCLNSYFDQTTGLITLRRVLNGIHLDIAGRTSSWTAGQWHRLCIGWCPALLVIYLDGRMEAAERTDIYGNQGKWGAGTANPFAVGSFYQTNAGIDGYSASPQSCFNGAIDEVVVLSRFPLPEEVHADYRRRKYQLGQEQSGRWTKYGTVISPGAGGSFDAHSVLETAVIDKGDGTIMGMYSAEDATPNYSLGSVTGSSPTALTKTSTSVPTIAAQTAMSTVVRAANGDVLLFYIDSASGIPYSDGTTVNRLRKRKSTNGTVTSWGAATTVLSSPGDVTSWNAGIANPCIWVAGTTLMMILEGYNGSIFQLGLYTSTNDGDSWTPFANNPLTSLQFWSGSSYSGATRVSAGGIDTLWYHVSLRGFGPSILACAQATDSTCRTWNIVTNDPILMPSTETLSGSVPGQMADACALEFAGSANLYYEVCRNNSGFAVLESRVDLAQYAGTFAQLMVDAPSLTTGGSLFVPASLSLGAGGPLLSNRLA